jgi:hypothetical protein
MKLDVQKQLSQTSLVICRKLLRYIRFLVPQLALDVQFSTTTCKTSIQSTTTCTERANRSTTNRKRTCGIVIFEKKTPYIFFLANMDLFLFSRVGPTCQNIETIKIK